jgi:hypothetical protein
VRNGGRLHFDNDRREQGRFLPPLLGNRTNAFYGRFVKGISLNLCRMLHAGDPNEGNRAGPHVHRLSYSSFLRHGGGLKTGTMSDSRDQAQKVAKLNDEFRRHAGVATSRSVPGRCVMTAGIAALGLEAQAEIFKRVREFSDFTPGNDPYGEHDFGSLTASGEEVLWKIDYFADARMELGSDNPADPARSYRVLTIMLACEY